MNLKNQNKRLEKICSKYTEKIKSVAHVGAHLGQEVLIYEKFCNDYIYLFEPQKNVFRKLEKNTKDFNNVIYDGHYNELGHQTIAKKIINGINNF